MKVELFDTNTFIDINSLKEVTSPTLFQRNGIPHPNGLISNEIFGVTIKSRKTTFAYIDLHQHFFHPHIYKAIKRMFRNIEKIVSGEEQYRIDKDGLLVLDNENGETGLEFIYENWDKIKWEYSDKTGMRNERIDLITKSKKEEVFTRYWLVIPPFYRDVKTDANGRGESCELNTFYAKLVRYATIVEDQSMFNFQLDNTILNMQNTLVEIYDYFKHKLEKKRGMLRRYLMGKTTDYANRVVITAPSYHGETPNDLIVNFKYTGIPIPLICSMTYPFMINWLLNFFEREIIKASEEKRIYDPKTRSFEDNMVKIKDPTNIFNEKTLKKMIDTYIRDQSSRFNVIKIPFEDGRSGNLTFVGKFVGASGTNQELIQRPMTWTDLLFMAANDIVKDKHVMFTRYPLLDEFGIFISKIRVLSTTKTHKVQVGNTIYDYYPNIEFGVPENEIGTRFIESMSFSNSVLPGLDGDYDGDQITVKILFTQEANDEVEKYINSVSYFINASGDNIRKTSSEVVQTYYSMTKEPTDKDRTLTAFEVDEFLKLKPEDLTFTNLCSIFADTLDNSNGKSSKVNKAKYKPTDKIHLKANQYFNKEDCDTTLGRLIVNKIICECTGLEDVIGYMNYVMTEKNYKIMEGKTTRALKEGKITTDQMVKYIEYRDWFGLQFHIVVTSSFTPGTLMIPKEVASLKKQLLKQYEKEIAAGDPTVAELIEKKLIEKTKEVLKDDVGMDLYNSGARGSLGNNYKNLNLMRGPIYNNITNKYDIITNSLSDGLKKRDIPANANESIGGAYPKAVGTRESGYLAKELMAATQTEMLDEKDSDCGSKRTIPYKITNKNKKEFVYRYIKENGKLVLMTPDNIDNYVGKVVQLRSPMYEIGAKLCNKCAGDLYYMLGKTNIGLMCSRPAETLKRLGMKKFHDSTLHSTVIDVDDMLI